VVTLPTQRETVILAIDVSTSMRADDVKPTRIAAVQAAAKAFVMSVPRSTRTGIVAFAGSAALVQAPTTRREDLDAAIDQLQLDNATAVGSGILASLKAIFPGQEFDAQAPQLLNAALVEAKKAEPVPPGSYKSAAIILLTDGQTNAGPEPVAAARLAAERGVRIFTVGVGTREGGSVGGDGWTMSANLDEEALKAIADLTRGEYFFAGTAPDLSTIYTGLNSKLVLEKQETEISALFAGLAAAFTLLAAALSLFWFRRVL
jgi:Ca-activated chloride channel family protein